MAAVTLTRRPSHLVKLSIACRGSSCRLFTTHGLLRRQYKWHPPPPPAFVPSVEQEKIARLCRTQNVVVTARPGSGKTATAEAIVVANRYRRVAVVTYSKALQVETKARLDKYSNCRVLTFHATAGMLFDNTILNDYKLFEERKAIRDFSRILNWSFEPFDVIVLDEFQDCTEPLFWLTNVFLLANKQKLGHSPRLVILGDERQSIYRFRGADSRFLSFSPELLKHNTPYPFVRVPLNESFRLPVPVVDFINNALLGGEKYITSSKLGPKPLIVRCRPLKQIDRLAEKLAELIEQYGVENSAIIAPSLNFSQPLKRLTNILSVKYGMPISVPMSDDSQTDEMVLRGKLRVSTIHQFKGSERDLVIVMGLDDSYMNRHCRNLPDDRCPNEVFVAMTRAKSQLVIIHDEDKKLMPFVDVGALYKTAKVINLTDNQDPLARDDPGRPLKTGLTLPDRVAATDIPRYVLDERLEEITSQHLNIEKLPPLPNQDHIYMKSIIPSDPKKGFHEDVSDLNGIVVGATMEHQVTGKLDSLLIDPKVAKTMPSVCSREYISWLCRHACHYQAVKTGYLPRSMQLRNHGFNWIKASALSRAQVRLREELDAYDKIDFEPQMKLNFKVDDEQTLINGQADIITTHAAAGDGKALGSVETIWEIKFVSQLSNQHVVQACIYAYMRNPENEVLPRIRLYNVRTGEKWEISSKDRREGLRRLIEDVLRSRYTTRGEMGDEEFVDMCDKTRIEAMSRGMM